MSDALIDKSEKMVGLNARIPLSLHNKIEQTQQTRGLPTKTAAFIWMLDEYLTNKERDEAQLLNDLETTFKVHDSVMMPIHLYKELTGKTQDLIDIEVEHHYLSLLQVGNSSFVCLDNKKQLDLSLIEQLNLKKDMMLMQKNIEKLNERITSLDGKK